MYVDIIVNKGTITNASNLQSGTTAELAAGQHKITFGTTYASADYDLVISCVDANGVPSAYSLDLKEVDGFTVTLSFNSIVSFIANL